MQKKAWAGEFGQSYTDRNTLSAWELDKLYLQYYGISRMQLNKTFLDNLPRRIQILEIGCNIGMQLRHLQQMGFYNLSGIELQQYALDNFCTNNVILEQSSAEDLPYSDNEFDLVFTSGVLIHIPPDDLPQVLEEIVRCTKRYVWGFEYFSEERTEIQYRGQSDLLWSANFPQLFVSHCPNLTVVKQEWVECQDAQQAGMEHIGHMYLLEKQ
jgi:pseudaminic acid biosynthesis-associated methylase